MVLFPGARLPFVVGRRSSIRTLELAVKVGDHLVLLTQRDSTEDSPEQAGIFEIGTLAQVEAIKRRLPNTQALVLPNCRHSPHRDQPKAVLETVSEFVRNLS